MDDDARDKILKFLSERLTREDIEELKSLLDAGPAMAADARMALDKLPASIRAQAVKAINDHRAEAPKRAAEHAARMAERFPNMNRLGR